MSDYSRRVIIESGLAEARRALAAAWDIIKPEIMPDVAADVPEVDFCPCGFAVEDCVTIEDCSVKAPGA